jgi:hypothetical protein
VVLSQPPKITQNFRWSRISHRKSSYFWQLCVGHQKFSIIFADPHITTKNTFSFDGFYFLSAENHVAPKNIEIFPACAVPCPSPLSLSTRRPPLGRNSRHPTPRRHRPIPCHRRPLSRAAFLCGPAPLHLPDVPPSSTNLLQLNISEQRTNVG